jgi:subtilisin family serine protease
MCFCLEKKSPVLSAAIQRAAADQIVMLASTADQGWNAREVWPARCEEVCGIAACTTEGAKATYAAHDDVDFTFPGQQISVTLGKNDPFHHANGQAHVYEVDGSSVATAIATGVASLILASERLILGSSNAPLETDRLLVSHRRELVREQFTKMTEGNHETRYVKPWTILHTRGTESEDFTRELGPKLVDHRNFQYHW